MVKCVENVCHCLYLVLPGFSLCLCIFHRYSTICSCILPYIFLFPLRLPVYLVRTRHALWRYSMIRDYHSRLAEHGLEFQKEKTHMLGTCWVSTLDLLIIVTMYIQEYVSGTRKKKRGKKMKNKIENRINFESSVCEACRSLSFSF